MSKLIIRGIKSMSEEEVQRKISGFETMLKDKKRNFFKKKGKF